MFFSLPAFFIHLLCMGKPLCFAEIQSYLELARLLCRGYLECQRSHRAMENESRVSCFPGLAEKLSWWCCTARQPSSGSNTAQYGCNPGEMANMTQKGSSFVLEWLPQTGSQPSKNHTDVHTPTANLGTVNIILTHMLASSATLSEGWGLQVLWMVFLTGKSNASSLQKKSHPLLTTIISTSSWLKKKV